MSLLAGPVFALAALLGFAGVEKLAWPQGAGAALRAAGLPSSDLAGRLLGVGEITAAAMAIAFGSRLTAGLLVLAYAAFAVFAGRLVRTADAASCGCFGQTDAPTTGVHVVLNVVAAVTCAAAVAWPTGSVTEVLADQPLAGVPFLALTGVAAWLWYVMLEVVPELQAALATVAADGRERS